MADWAVWPVFLVQFIAFALLLFKNRRLCGMYTKTWSFLLMIAICIAIVLSVWHDSTDQINLYF
jgi:hypothetical protein